MLAIQTAPPPPHTNLSLGQPYVYFRGILLIRKGTGALISLAIKSSSLVMLYSTSPPFPLNRTHHSGCRRLQFFLDTDTSSELPPIGAPLPLSAGVHQAPSPSQPVVPQPPPPPSTAYDHHADLRATCGPFSPAARLPHPACQRLQPCLHPTGPAYDTCAHSRGIARAAGGTHHPSTTRCILCRPGGQPALHGHPGQARSSIPNGIRCCSSLTNPEELLCSTGRSKLACCYGRGVHALLSNNTWDLVPRPPNTNFCFWQMDFQAQLQC